MTRCALIGVALALLVVQVCSLACSSTDGSSFANNQYDVKLFNLSSADKCCAACGNFDECLYYNYVKDAASADYKSCFIRRTNAGQKSDSQSTAGNVGRQPPTSFCSTVQAGKDYNSSTLAVTQNAFSQDACCEACANYPGCGAWTWINSSSLCYLKSSASNSISNAGALSGTVTHSLTPAPLKTSKRGIAWFDSHSCSDLRNLKGISWLYNWGLLPDANLVPCMAQLGIEFVPLIWGSSGINDLKTKLWPSGKHFMGFNEPNFASQSNLTPQQAAALWPQIEAVADAHNLKIGSPAAAPGGKPVMPADYLEQFFGNCTNCRVDYITTHVYECAVGGVEYWIGTLKKFNKPIWLTEFSCPAAGKDVAVELKFMTDVLAYLDSEPAIERYSWFGTRVKPSDSGLGSQVSLFKVDDCALSDLGKLYVPN